MPGILCFGGKVFFFGLGELFRRIRWIRERRA